MKRFSLTEGPIDAFIEIALKKRGLSNVNAADHIHPAEDFSLKSDAYPICAVADGVTLIQYLLDRKPYPHPSPAGDISRIFCEALIKAAEEKYGSFAEQDISEVFRIANAAAGEYNRRLGRIPESSDFWDKDLYAATAAYAICKGDTVYWGSICDSYVAHVDSSGQLKFRSPESSSLAQAKPGSQFEGDPLDHKARAQYVWKATRNRLNSKGERIGYGVVTGEPEAEKYLSRGSFKIQKGDIVAIYTDGFEEHMKSLEFVSLLAKWPSDLESQIKKLTASMAATDPEAYGRERSLMALHF